VSWLSVGCYSTNAHIYQSLSYPKKPFRLQPQWLLIPSWRFLSPRPLKAAVAHVPTFRWPEGVRMLLRHTAGSTSSQNCGTNSKAKLCIQPFGCKTPIVVKPWPVTRAMLPIVTTIALCRESTCDKYSSCFGICGMAFADINSVIYLA
jgi:hypothetical protein